MALENLEDAAANESAEDILAHAAAENTATDATAPTAESATTTPNIVPSALANKIAKVDVTFTSAIRDANNHVMPHGTAIATYGNGNTMSIEVTGGANVRTYGITDVVTDHPIYLRCQKIFRNSKNQPMPYALFYNGGEALHVGRLDRISHGCVHVGDEAKMKKLHDDSVTNVTKVTVRYADGVLDKVMKQRG